MHFIPLAALAPLLFAPQWQYSTKDPDLANTIRVDWSKVVWDLEGTIDTPYFGTHYEQCTLDGFGHATARVDARTSHVDASGSAHDNCTGDDVRMTESGTGIYGQSFDYLGDREGMVSVSATVAVSGNAKLIDDDCAAAALGDVEFSCSLGASIIAKLNKSLGQTVSYGLGTVGGAFAGATFQVPITSTTGEGTYADQDQAALPGLEGCGVGHFSYTAKTRGYINVWANSYLAGSSYCTARMWGRINATITLSEC